MHRRQLGRQKIGGSCLARDLLPRDLVAHSPKNYQNTEAWHFCCPSSECIGQSVNLEARCISSMLAVICLRRFAISWLQQKQATSRELPTSRRRFGDNVHD